MTDAVQKICYFGGTFDPPHLGHLVIAAEALERAGLDRVVFLPSAAPPHKEGPKTGPEAAFADRLAMTAWAIEGEPRFEASDLENRREGPSYTVDLLRRLQKETPPSTRLFFLIGSDWIPRLHTWRRIEAVFDLCCLLVAERPGFPRESLADLGDSLRSEWIERLDDGWLDSPLIGISSTDVRRRIAKGRTVRYLVPDRVLHYIREKGLYQRR